MATIRVTCRACGTQFDVATTLARFVAECPNCHRQVHGGSPQGLRPVPTRLSATSPRPPAAASCAEPDLNAPRPSHSKAEQAALSAATGLPSPAQCLWAGLLGFFLGGILAGGFTASSRYTTRAYKQQVARADKAESALVASTAKQKDLESALAASAKKEKALEGAVARAEVDARRAREELASLHEKMGSLNAQSSGGTSGEVITSDRAGAAPAGARADSSAPLKGVTYNVMSDNRRGRIKVRLNRAVPEAALSQVAESVKNQHPGSHGHDGRRETFFYLPGMASDAEAWARASFEPTAAPLGRWRIEIFGITAEEEQVLGTKGGETAAAETIGTWLDDTVGLSRRITIRKKEDKFFAESRFRDGSGHEIEVAEDPSLDGQRFRYANDTGRPKGGYYLINGAGELEEWVRIEPNELLTSDVEVQGDYALYTRARRLP